MSILFAATYPDRASHLILVGGFSRAADRMSDDLWQARLEQIGPIDNFPGRTLLY